jgi:hypothetical protein
MASTPLPEASKANGDVVNGTNGTETPNGTSTTPRTPQRTPSLTSLALTEYSAKPSPPSEERSARINKIVPDEFLLPNGHPDVSGNFCCYNCSGGIEVLTMTVNLNSTSALSSHPTPEFEKSAPKFL